MKQLLSSIGKSGLLLASFAFVSVIILAVVNDQTEDKIKENQRQALLKQLSALVNPNDYDNALDQSVIELPSGILGSKKSVKVYLAKKQQQPIAALFLVTTTKGYNGAISLLVGVNKDQSVSGVRVVAHKETPGLGDKIDLVRNDWILDFAGKSLSKPSEARWSVKKDGGDFDQFTGATITPRAVVGAVKDVLIWSQSHFDELFTDKYKALSHE